MLPNGVDRRIGHLREKLLEIIVQKLGTAGEHGQGRIGPHGGYRIFSLLRHGAQSEDLIFIRVAEELFLREQRHLGHLSLFLLVTAQKHLFGRGDRGRILIPQPGDRLRGQGGTPCGRPDRVLKPLFSHSP